MTRRRLTHYGPDRTYPFRTACGAGQTSLSTFGRARWRSVDITHAADAVTCPACRTAIRPTPTVTISKAWDDNERSREGRNGRIYTSSAGRWQWEVYVDNVFDSAHDRRRDAERRADRIEEGGR